MEFDGHARKRKREAEHRDELATMTLTYREAAPNARELVDKVVTPVLPRS